MRLLLKLIGLCVVVLLSACQPPKPSVIDESRITKISVECHAFDDSIQTLQLEVLDVTVDSVKKAFGELFYNNFPIYMITGYENRLMTDNDTKISLHAYGAAIDINYHINPYYNVLKGTSSIEPKRFTNRTKDEEKIISFLKEKREFSESELSATMKAVIQELDSDDWFVNREVHRKGMLTRKEAEIFEKNGFTIWGGTWRQPMDFMHFQIPIKLAEVLAATSKEEGEVIWKNHLLLNKWHLQLKKKLETFDKEKGEAIWTEHLSKCQSDGGYLIAANKADTASVCLEDCKRKYKDIDALQKNTPNKHKSHLKK